MLLKKPVIISLVAMVILLVLGSIAYANIADPPKPPQEPTEAKAIDLGVLYQVNNDTPGLDKTKALEITNARYGDLKPTEITTQHVHFTDTELGIKKRAAWLVTYKGVKISSHGPANSPKRTHNELNIVIDSSSGDILESYSIK